MKCGKLTESIYNRSVRKIIKSNGAGLRTDCAVLTGSATCNGILSGQALAFGTDKRTAARAYLAAVNHVIACCANYAALGLFETSAHMTLMIPERVREVKVRMMMEAAALQAEETGISIQSCNVQVLPAVTQTVASCVISAGLEKHLDETVVPIKEKTLADADIVMTKWLGLEGTAIMAAESYNKLCARYPSDIVDTAMDFYRYLSIAPEAATAVKSGADYLLALREGGIFGGLWQLAAENGVGLVADLKHIPVRQETIEVCEYFDLNPYELLAGGSLLIVTANGGEMVRALEKAGVPAAVIGRTTQGNDRVICHGEETRYLEPANGDAIFQYYAQVETSCNECLCTQGSK